MRTLRFEETQAWQNLIVSPDGAHLWMLVRCDRSKCVCDGREYPEENEVCKHDADFIKGGIVAFYFHYNVSQGFWHHKSHNLV